MGRGIRSAVWVFGSAVLAGLSLRPWVGDEIFLTRYVGYVMPWLLLGLAPGAAWAWWTRQRALAAVLGTSTAIVLAAHAPQVRRAQPPPAPPGTRLKVMSWNTWSENRDAARIADVVLRHAPDILLLQEIPPPVYAGVVARLGNLYGGAPVHSAYDAALLQGVLSRLPIESAASMEEKGKAQRVILRTPGSPIAVFNVHPLRTGGWKRRCDEIASLLRENIERERGPVILGGDFNAPEHSEPYRMISAHLANAHREAGVGFGFTYPSSSVRWGRFGAFAVVRIDHIFFSEHFVATRAATLRDHGGSDHYPVVAELALARSGTIDATGPFAGTARAWRGCEAPGVPSVPQTH